MTFGCQVLHLAVARGTSQYVLLRTADENLVSKQKQMCTVKSLSA